MPATSNRLPWLFVGLIASTLACSFLQRLESLPPDATEQIFIPQVAVQEATEQVFIPNAAQPSVSEQAKTAHIYIPQAAQANLKQASTETPAPKSLDTLTPTIPLSATPVPPNTATPTNTRSPTRLPTFTPVANDTTRQLAYLRDGNLWRVTTPYELPIKLTNEGDLLSFAWAPDGRRIATYNGRRLCLLRLDGSLSEACIDLGLTSSQRDIPRQIAWSPDQKTITLWNSYNPWDSDALGWLVLWIDGSGMLYRIADPMDWGAELSSSNQRGGITGEALYLPDGVLVGTLTHSQFCGSGGCTYQLYDFDLTPPNFDPYPNYPPLGWSGGESLDLSSNGKWLANFNVVHEGCETYTSTVDSYHLQTHERRWYSLEQKALHDLSLSPNGDQAVISRTTGCSSENVQTWPSDCGLNQAYDVLSMQIWDLQDNERRELLPGLYPDWSPDGSWIVFQSCLMLDDFGNWQTTSSGSPSIFLISPDSGRIIRIAEGGSPAWRP